MSPLPRGDHMDAGHSSPLYQSAQQRSSYDDRYDRDPYREDDGVLIPSSPQFETAPVDSERARMETAELIEQQFLDGRAITATPSADPLRNPPIPRRPAVVRHDALQTALAFRIRPSLQAVGHQGRFFF